MAIPKKGSRSIVVDDVPYRWRIRGAWGSDLTVAVEPVTDDNLFTSLIVDTSALAPLGVAYPEPVSVTPAVVEAYIRQALARGWKPGEKGKPFVLVADAAMVTGKT